MSLINATAYIYLLYNYVLFTYTTKTCLHYRVNFGTIKRRNGPNVNAVIVSS